MPRRLQGSRGWALLAVLIVAVGLAVLPLHTRPVVLGFGLALISLPVALGADVLAWLAVVAVNPAYRAPMGREGQTPKGRGPFSEVCGLSTLV
jgi:hypothetical protein